MTLNVVLTLDELSEKTHLKKWFIRNAIKEGWMPYMRGGPGKNAPFLFDEELVAEAIREHMKPIGQTSEGGVVYIRPVKRAAT